MNNSVKNRPINNEENQDMDSDIADYAIPFLRNMENTMIYNPMYNFSSQVPDLSIEREGSSVSIPLDNGEEAVFSTPGLILNELYQLCRAKSNINEKNSAIIDYIRLILHNIK